MYCSKCGGAMADGAAFCSNCGQGFAVAAGPPPAPMMSASVAPPIGGGAASIPAYAGYVAVPRVEYAGFWLRFLALLIDNVILGLGFILILIPLIFLTGLGGFLGELHPNEDISDIGIFMLVGLYLSCRNRQPDLDGVVPRADGVLGVAGHSREEGAGSGGDGYGGTARQLRAFDGKALRQDHHQHGACTYRIHHGGVHGEKTGAARHDRGLSGRAAKQLKQAVAAKILAVR